VKREEGRGKREEVRRWRGEEAFAQNYKKDIKNSGFYHRNL
jgi:hypothetical protein